MEAKVFVTYFLPESEKCLSQRRSLIIIKYSNDLIHKVCHFFFKFHKGFDFVGIVVD